MVLLEANAHLEITVQRVHQLRLLVQEVLLSLETVQMNAKIALKVSIVLKELTHQLSVLMVTVQLTVKHQLYVRMELTDQLTSQE